MIQSTDLGTYIEHQGRPAIRFVRTYPHPVERVWCAITDSEELRAWFPSAVTLEQRVGGTITFSFDPNTEDSTGTVLLCEPPYRLAYTWDGDELHYELEAIGEGQCRLTFVNVLHERNTAARNGAGWAVCFAELDRALAGHPAAGPHAETATPWQPIYEAYVAAGVPSGAPIPSTS